MVTPAAIAPAEAPIGAFADGRDKPGHDGAAGSIRPKPSKPGRPRVAALSAAVPGTTIQTTSARRTATGPTPTTGTTTSASGSPGRLPLKSLSPYLLGPGAKPLARFFWGFIYSNSPADFWHRGRRQAGVFGIGISLSRGVRFASALSGRLGTGHDFTPMQIIGTSLGACDLRSSGSHGSFWPIGIPASSSVLTSKSLTALLSPGFLTTQTMLPHPRTVASRLYDPTAILAASSAERIWITKALVSPSSSPAMLMAANFPLNVWNTSACSFDKLLGASRSCNFKFSFLRRSIYRLTSV